MRTYIILLVVFMFTSTVAYASDEYTPTTETHCIDSVCTKTLYSSVQYVYEDSQWKHITKARSLKDAWKKFYIKDDAANYDINFTEYNYTYLEGTLWVKTKSTIPFKICFNEILCRSYNVVFVANTYNFIFDFLNNKTIVNGMDVKFANIASKNPLSLYNWTLGSSTTTVKLQTPNTENMEDTYVDFTNPTSNYGSSQFLYVNGYGGGDNRSDAYIKFNLGALPSGITIMDSILWTSWGLAITGNVQARHVYNHTWHEDSQNGAITWNDQPCDANLTNAIECNLTAASTLSNPNSDELVFNVTVPVSVEVSNNHKNVSIIINASYDPNPGSMFFISKEYSSSRPYLNITYRGSYPTWYLNQSYTPTNYSSSTSCNFNITWNVTSNDISTVYIESNYSGASMNYTMSNNTYGGNIYNYSTAIIPGTFYWRSYANNTIGNDWNSSDTWYFTIGCDTPAISGVSRSPDCVQIPTANVIISFTQSDAYNITQSYCNWTSPSSSVTKTNSSLTYNVGDATCQLAPTEAGAWYYTVYAIDTTSNLGQSSSYSFNAVTECVSGGGPGPGGGGGGATVATVVVSQCAEGWKFDNATQRCLPIEPIMPDFERTLMQPVIGPLTPFYIFIGLLLLLPMLGRGGISWKKMLR